MHILLTDVLACPRCGPDFGLILLADRVQARRVLQGFLGCPNCREEYPIRDGVSDLRFPPSLGPVHPTAPVAATHELALRVAALLGVRTPGARIVLIGAGADLAQELSGLLPDVEVIGVVADPEASEHEEAGVSLVAAGSVLPFQGGKLHGAALLGGVGEASLVQVARVLAPGARLLIEPVSGSIAEALAAAGLDLLLEEAASVLVSRQGVAHPRTHS